jgi:hypothetical protein
VEQNDPAWKIAEATLALLNSGPNTLDTALTDLKASARDIARAYAQCLSQAPFSQYEANRLILNTRLQVALVQEHVAAEQRMGRTFNILTGVLVVLTIALVFLGGIDIWAKLEHRSPAHGRHDRLCAEFDAQIREELVSCPINLWHINCSPSRYLVSRRYADGSTESQTHVGAV